jgi:hypothetical protein
VVTRERSDRATAALLNARVAVEHDPVRRHDILVERRLAAAVYLAPRVEVAEALLAGIPVPAERLDPARVRCLALRGSVVLDDALALEVVAAGRRLSEEETPRRRAA